jgi:hypothetical protein
MKNGRIQRDTVILCYQYGINSNGATTRNRPQKAMPAGLVFGAGAVRGVGRGRVLTASTGGVAAAAAAAGASGAVTRWVATSGAAAGARQPVGSCEVRG